MRAGKTALRGGALLPVMLLGILPVSACSSTGGTGPSGQAPIPPGKAQVARLPHGDGLQYCINLRPRDLAPPGTHDVFIHSFSVYITNDDPTMPTLLAITGRYPGWDTPGTTIYNQPFTNTNTVWLEILHEFPLGISCIEAYGHRLEPSGYALFKNRILVAYSYMGHKRGWTGNKLFPVIWGHYLAQYSPRHRPKH